jgi:long-subunit acyl-CoA synthetase (AMP-forming)
MTQQYGLSETNSVIVGHGGEDYLRRPLSTGLPAIVNEVKVMDPEGKEVKQGDIGELWVKGPNVFKGYYKNQKATDECLTRDGWFRT